MFYLIVTACLEPNGLDINNRTKKIQNLEKSFSKCLLEFNSTYCDSCKQSYLDLTGTYDIEKSSEEFCMDIVDLVSFQYLINVF